MERIRREVSQALTRYLPGQCAVALFKCVNWLCCCGSLGSLEDALGGGNNGMTLRVLVIGLDQSGKTALVTRLQAGVAGLMGGQIPEYVPTEGFQVQTVMKDGHTIEFWEIGGSKDYRSLWELQTEEKNAVIFVMNKSRQQEAKDALINFRQRVPDIPVVAVFVVYETGDSLAVELDRDVEVVPVTLGSPQSMSLVWRTVIDVANV